MSLPLQAITGLTRHPQALVAAMNVHGFRTICVPDRGMVFPVTKLPPYIAFACPVKMAALSLAARLRQDAESAIPRLTWDGR